MKTEIKEINFTPLTLEVTFENRKELMAFYALMNATGSLDFCESAVRANEGEAKRIAPSDIEIIGKQVFDLLLTKIN